MTDDLGKIRSDLSRDYEIKKLPLTDIHECFHVVSPADSKKIFRSRTEALAS